MVFIDDNYVTLFFPLAKICSLFICNISSLYSMSPVYYSLNISIGRIQVLVMNRESLSVIHGYRYVFHVLDPLKR